MSILLGIGAGLECILCGHEELCRGQFTKVFAEDSSFGLISSLSIDKERSGKTKVQGRVLEAGHQSEAVNLETKSDGILSKGPYLSQGV